jgi:hypothetical protein
MDSEAHGLPCTPAASRKGSGQKPSPAWPLPSSREASRPESRDHAQASYPDTLFGVTGFKLRALHLQSRLSTT